MRSVKVTDAKNNLSRHLAYVRRGGRVRIYDRDVPVADLVPVDPVEAPGDEEARLARLERLGVVRRGGGGLVEELLEPGPPDPEGRALAALLEERRGGR